MQSVLDRFGHLLAFALVVGLALVAWKFGAPPEITSAIGVVLAAMVVQAAKQSQPPPPPAVPVASSTKRITLDPKTPASGAFIALVMLALGLSACSSVPPLPQIPKGSAPLTVVQAIASSAVELVQWAEKRGITPATVGRARKAVEARDYREALALLSEAVAASRAAGEPIPEEVERTLRLAEGAAAAQVIEDFGRAMNSSGSIRDAGTPPP